MHDDDRQDIFDFECMISRTVGWINLLTANNKRWHQALYAEKLDKLSWKNLDGVLEIIMMVRMCLTSGLNQQPAALVSHSHSCSFFARQIKHSFMFVLPLAFAFYNCNLCTFCGYKQFPVCHLVRCELLMHLSGTSCFYLIRKIAAMLTFFIEWTVVLLTFVSPAGNNLIEIINLRQAWVMLWDRIHEMNGSSWRK